MRLNVDCRAQFEAGTGAFDHGNFQEALKIWKPMAERADASAQWLLGHLYDDGNGVERSFKMRYIDPRALVQNRSQRRQEICADRPRV